MGSWLTSFVVALDQLNPKGLPRRQLRGAIGSDRDYRGSRVILTPTVARAGDGLEMWPVPLASVRTSSPLSAIGSTTRYGCQRSGSAGPG